MGGDWGGWGEPWRGAKRERQKGSGNLLTHTHNKLSYVLSAGLCELIVFSKPLCWKSGISWKVMAKKRGKPQKVRRVAPWWMRE